MNRIAQACFVLLAGCSLSSAQGLNVLSVVPGAPLKAKTGTIAEGDLTLQMQAGYHCNSNTPSDAYLIPLRLTWNPGPLQAASVIYPKPQMEKYSFSDKPLSVFSGKFDILTRFKVPANAVQGPTAVSGKLRYQACNDRMCLAPKTMNVTLQVDVVK